MSSPETILNKINNQISYESKDIIILAMICYMKIDEADINKKNVFITASEEDDAYENETRQQQQQPSVALEPAVSAYHEKYKYLYT